MGTGYEISTEHYRRLRPKLYALIRRMGVGGQEIEDVIQETFLHVQRGLDQGAFDERSSLDTWIVSIGKKRALKHRRRLAAAKRRGIERSLDAPASSDAPLLASITDPRPGPEQRVADRQILRLFARGLEALPETFRQPLVLQVAGLSYQEIGSVLGISEGLVTSRVHQARAKLRRLAPRPPRGSPN